MVTIHRYLEGKTSRLIGPNCPGIISPPAKCKIGIMPGYIHKPGNVAWFHVAVPLPMKLLPNSLEKDWTVDLYWVGWRFIAGTTFIDIMKLFEADSETKAVVLIGEIGGQLSRMQRNISRNT